jgi:hypothetical protein
MKIEKLHANMKWWKGFCIGWISGITYTSLLYLYFHQKLLIYSPT